MRSLGLRILMLLGLLAPVWATATTPMVAAGTNHSLALKSDGTVVAWGYNFFGQLGDRSRTDRRSPTWVGGLTSVVAVTAGDSHSLALKENGTVAAWGSNSSGQLGNGSITSSTTPVA